MTPCVDPMRELGTYRIGGTMFSIHRGPSSVQVVLYEVDSETPRWFASAFPTGADDCLALHWSIDLAVWLGAMGEIYLVAPGSIEHNQIEAVALAAHCIQKAAACS